MKSLLGIKIGMTQIIDKDGRVSAVTLIESGPNVVTQTKIMETDGYNAVQLGFGKGKNISKPLSGHLKKSKASSKFIKEFRLDKIDENVKTGDTIDISEFSIGDIVKISGTSKGKGFAGTVKRHNFNTSKKTHGGNGDVRKPGSIGSMYPQKVFKGKKMAGRMGHQKVTVRNLQIVFIDKDKNLIGIKGAIPGPRKSLVMIGSMK